MIVSFVIFQHLFAIPLSSALWPCSSSVVDGRYFGAHQGSVLVDFPYIPPYGRPVPFIHLVIMTASLMSVTVFYGRSLWHALDCLLSSLQMVSSSNRAIRHRRLDDVVDLALRQQH
ncbi:hypothetical protein BCR43DRAFT_145281 [Syncephalastrum racemosum]|uniref:Secreted peptide n=1 Tax=Syncephalastrum racemosum TaxID=13706 RepID=A0A1X2HMM2_SYNRA|nr:hypothetical protein BCR43DRAFT_145281 [Syncephalastrum racemosum]